MVESAWPPELTGLSCLGLNFGSRFLNPIPLTSMRAILLVLLLSKCFTHATTFTSAEGAFVQQTAAFVAGYAQSHNGNPPQSWAEIDQDPVFGERVLQGFIPFRKRYAFVNPPVLLPAPHNVELFLITRRPFHDQTLDGFIGLRSLGRYLVFRSKSGECKSLYVKEEVVHEMFRGMEHLLPAPDSEPLRRHEFIARCWLAGFSVAGCLLLFGLFRWSLRNWAWRFSREFW